MVEKKPGAMALTRIPISAKCTAIHSVKFFTAAFAALYAGILVSGRNAFIEVTITMQPLPFSAISLAKICVGIRVPKKFKLNTKLMPWGSRSKKVLTSGSC